jgi:hypothetical protein
MQSPLSADEVEEERKKQEKLDAYLDGTELPHDDPKVASAQAAFAPSELIPRRWHG